ncbi:AEC family transporter [Alphaproteobacteria bacterium]|nr:AEC family transporter [Alphaproteobacteria bacterium]
MLIALFVVAPVIAVIALGYGAAWRGVFSEDNVATLNRFVFTLAAPALLFRNVALTDFPDDLSIGLWVSYYAPMLAIMALVFFIGRLFFPTRGPAEYVLLGFGACFSNTVMLGIPIILTAFGPGAGLPLFLILAFHGLLVFTAALTCLEAATNPQMRLKDMPPKLAHAMRDQAVVMALAAGVVWNFTGLGLAAPIDRFLELVGAAAIPVALIAVGGRLAFIAVGDNLPVALFVGVFKLALMPSITVLEKHAPKPSNTYSHYLFGLPPLFVATITLLSAMPSGVFTAVFAAQYKVAEAEASSMIVVTTVLSAFTISLWLTFFSDLLVAVN